MNQLISAHAIHESNERRLAAIGIERFPALIERAGEKAALRFLEFFTANIRNKNTRLAYGHAVAQFFAWCDERGLELQQLNPVWISAYIEQHPAARLAGIGKRRPLKRSEAAGFEVLVTTDKNLSYQQNLSGRKIAIVVLGQGRWSLIRPHVAKIVSALNAATPGSFAEVEIPYE